MTVNMTQSVFCLFEFHDPDPEELYAVLFEVAIYQANEGCQLSPEIWFEVGRIGKVGNS